MPIQPSQPVRIDADFLIKVHVFSANDANAPKTKTAEGESKIGGISLSEIRQRFGGNEFDIKDPSGKSHHVSLLEWADANPDEVFVQIAFEWPLEQEERIKNTLRAAGILPSNEQSP